jgi:hypothetical protein
LRRRVERGSDARPLLVGLRWALLDALVDVGLVHPATQARLADPQIQGDLADRLLPQPSQLHSTTPELHGLAAGINGLLSETILASDQVSGEPGQAPGVRRTGSGSNEPSCRRSANHHPERTESNAVAHSSTQHHYCHGAPEEGDCSGDRQGHTDGDRVGA